MPLAYEIHPANGILVYVASGEVSVSDIMQCMTAVSGDPEFDAGHSVVLVLDDQLQLHNLDIDQIRQITGAGIGMFGRGELDRPSYHAIICPEGAHDIFARFFAAAVESTPNARAQHRICRSRAELEQWTRCTVEGIRVIELALAADYAGIRELYDRPPGGAVKPDPNE